MNSNRLAVFAAFLQWANAVKVVSRGTLRSRTSVTWGIRWSVSAAEKDGERGGRFSTVRHEHLLGLIGRSNFPAQAQDEEREQGCKEGSLGNPYEALHSENVQACSLPQLDIIILVQTGSSTYGSGDVISSFGVSL